MTTWRAGFPTWDARNASLPCPARAGRSGWNLRCGDCCSAGVWAGCSAHHLPGRGVGRRRGEIPETGRPHPRAGRGLVGLGAGGSSERRLSLPERRLDGVEDVFLLPRLWPAPRSSPMICPLIRGETVPTNSATMWRLSERAALSPIADQLQ